MLCITYHEYVYVCMNVCLASHMIDMYIYIYTYIIIYIYIYICVQLICIDIIFPSFQFGSPNIPSSSWHRLVFPPQLSTELEDFAHLHQPQEALAQLPGGDGDGLGVGGWGMDVRLDFMERYDDYEGNDIISEDVL